MHAAGHATPRVSDCQRRRDRVGLPEFATGSIHTFPIVQAQSSSGTIDGGSMKQTQPRYHCQPARCRGATEQS